MAITATHLTSDVSTTNATTYDTASISPGSNRLVLGWVVGLLTGGSPEPTLSGNGLTWVQVNTVEFNDIATPQCRLTLFRAMGASPSAGATTIDFGSQQAAAGWSFTDFDGVDTGGVNGSAAVVQSANTVADSVTGLTTILSAFGDAGNATTGGVGKRRDQSTSPGSGFTELADQNSGGESLAVHAEWRYDNDTTVDTTWGSGTDAGGVAIEIKAGNGATVTKELDDTIGFVDSSARDFWGDRQL
jgi:hypothetical protein